MSSGLVICGLSVEEILRDTLTTHRRSSMCFAHGAGRSAGACRGNHLRKGPWSGTKGVIHLLSSVAGYTGRRCGLCTACCCFVLPSPVHVTRCPFGAPVTIDRWPQNYCLSLSLALMYTETGKRSSVTP